MTLRKRRVSPALGILWLAALASGPGLWAGGAPAPASLDAPPQDHLVLVTNWGDDSVSLVDVAAGQVLSNIAVGPKPYDVKVDASGRFAYVSASGASDVSVIDVQANLEAYRIGVRESPRDISLSSDGQRLAVANSGANSVSIVDLQTRSELFAVPVGSIPYGVEYINGDQQLLVTNWGQNTLSVVTLGATSGSVTKTLSVAGLPYTVLVPPGQGTAYMTNFAGGVVTPVHLATLELRPTIPVGRSPWGVAASVDGSKIFVANFYDNHISVLSTASNTVIARIPLTTTKAARRAAKNVATSSAHIVASDLAANQLIVIDPSTLQVVRTVPVGKAPYGLAFLKSEAAQQAARAAVK